MRVIICGAGQVGRGIAAYLAKEDNNITVIEENPALVDQIQNEMDVNAIQGHPSNPNILNAAGAKEADILIAVTDSDETNMVACQVAHSLFSIPKKIARIRKQAYLDPAWSNLFSRSHLPIDVIISPEILVANDIFQRLSVPGTTTVINVADNKVKLVGVICAEDCPVLGTQLGQMAKLFPDLSFRVVSIIRNNKTIIPDEQDVLEVGDEVYIVLDNRHLRRVMAAFGHLEREARKIIVSGAGNIGLSLIKVLQKDLRGLQLKIIEKDPVRAKFLSEELSNSVIIEGDTLDRTILEEAGVGTSEAYIALMNDDENNILGSLLAKQYGCERVITLVNNNAYYPLVGPLGIDVMVSPRSTIVAHTMKYVRRGRIKGIHNLGDGASELMEIEISETSQMANRQIFDIDLPRGVVIGAVVRKDTVIIPDENTDLLPEDHVIILSLREKARAVEKIFSARVETF